MPEIQRCGETTKRGGPCRRRILADRDACHLHGRASDDVGHGIDGPIPGIDEGPARLRWLWEVTTARITPDLMIRDHCALMKRLEIVAKMWDERYEAADGESVLDEVSSRLRLITADLA